MGGFFFKQKEGEKGRRAWRLMAIRQRYEKMTLRGMKGGLVRKEGRNVDREG